ncbi:MAG: hypothetical protein H0X15_00610 [Acidobacteria bacterium]|jgi:hypothetical protein|nr:hypothetical protein [Acidobacteriota bacterium]MBA3784034.1 hypothetical protein [Acidobacteriota bacterium]
MKNRKNLYVLILFVWLFGTNENILSQRRKAPPKKNVGVKTTKIILDRSRFAVIPPEVYQAIERAKAKAKDEKKKAL